MIAFPNAKINLGLDIIRRRDDEYHDIVTAMVGVEWHDVLEIVPGVHSADTITVTGIAVDCPPEKNLVIKAVRAVRDLHDIPPVDVYLEKVIPFGAGLGGGSSDATSAILLLNEIFALGMSVTEMSGIAASIGSDCPFFVYNRPMIARGRGEQLKPLTMSDKILKDYRMLIIVPDGCAVSTAEAYAGVTPAAPAVDVADIVSQPCEIWAKTLKNDFEKTIFAKHPILATIKDDLYAAGARYAAMSGSGSAVFGIFDRDIPSDVISELIKRHSNGYARYCGFVG